jgi:hypothetical protein
MTISPKARQNYPNNIYRKVTIFMKTHCLIKPKFIIITLLIITGCTLDSVENPAQHITSTTGPSPTLSQQPIQADSQWQTLAPGLELRHYIPDGNKLSQITALRIDPTLYAFRVHYRPGEALNFRQWNDELPGALAFINGNFFDANDFIVAMLVADGVVYGQSYRGFGGTFIVENDIPRIRSNVLEPYDGSYLQQAVQAFPMLVLNGEQAYFDDTQERITRRTVIGQDVQGRIIIMATPGMGMTLAETSAYLVSTDMELVNALNLDGGGSTMMVINTPGSNSYSIMSFDPVPAVLAVYLR